MPLRPLRYFLFLLVALFAADISVVLGTYCLLPNTTLLLKGVELERIGSDFKKFKFLAGPKNRKYEPLSRISRFVPRAILSLEDSRFYQHRGVDLIEVYDAIEESWEEGERLRGASTISQQLVKNLYLSPERTFQRKIFEALITVKLELTLTKTQILEIYVNSIDWGRGLFGIRDAAFYYFKKSPNQLSLKESIFLAAIIPNPRRFGQLNNDMPKRFVRRQMMKALRDLFRQGQISIDDFQETLRSINQEL